MTALWLRDNGWVPQHWLANFWVRITVEHKVHPRRAPLVLLGQPPTDECRWVAMRIPCLRPDATTDDSRLHIAVAHFTEEKP